MSFEPSGIPMGPPSGYPSYADGPSPFTRTNSHGDFTPFVFNDSGNIAMHTAVNSMGEPQHFAFNERGDRVMTTKEHFDGAEAAAARFQVQAFLASESSSSPRRGISAHTIRGGNYYHTLPDKPGESDYEKIEGASQISALTGFGSYTFVPSLKCYVTRSKLCVPEEDMRRRMQNPGAKMNCFTIKAPDVNNRELATREVEGLNGGNPKFDSKYPVVRKLLDRAVNVESLSDLEVVVNLRHVENLMVKVSQTAENNAEWRDDFARLREVFSLLRQRKQQINQQDIPAPILEIPVASKPSLLARLLGRIGVRY